MVSVQSPPGGRELPYARVLLLPAILMAAATGAAVAVLTGPARIAVGWSGAIATVLVTTVIAMAVRHGRTVRALRADFAQRSAYLEQRIASQDSDIDFFRTEILSRALPMVHAGVPTRQVIRMVIDDHPELRQLPQPQRKLLRTLLDIIDKEIAIRDSSQRAFVNIARRVQAIVHQQAKELREMEEDHGRNPEVFDDLLRIDHGTALIGRLADSIAVIGGGRPGRQWPAPVPLYSVLRGAMSRILEYRRIELHSIAKVNIKGISVEPIIHATAELLDNATRYSPPQTKVHVTATQVQTGIAVEIEDGGISLSEESRAKVELRLAEAQAGRDVQEVGEAPRLGLAVVGRLSSMFNMHVSLRQSAYGGVRAIIVIPNDMLTTDPAPGFAHGIGATSVPTLDNDGVEGPDRKAKKRRPTTGPRIPEQFSMEDDVPVVTEWTANGLPQRRSRVKIPLSQRIAEAAAAEAAAKAAEAATHSPWTPEPEPEKEEPAPGLWVEAFMAGLKADPDPNAFSSGPPADDPHAFTNDEPAPAQADDEGDFK
ncbi:ATP-binding protein [Streptomyces yaanensis]|uniref:histidine kinase n=1 Tax=Streptomyces yaanensis TaxID=1142239 RepID=A0ABV7SJN3_9ACTN|nr:ATP-binding protein [Streptomyces sp. CGMCC 4.7035]WNC00800.1 ATP-binding protein [Streptomyces sp. CGMCC 4.7035]